MPTISGIIAALLAVLLAFKWLTSKKSRFNILISKLPPGPPPLPLVGNALELIGGFDHVFKTIWETWPSKYGEIYCTYIGSLCNVNISSPELAEAIFSSNKIIDKGADYDFARPWIGDGLLTSTGAKWKSRRRLLTPAFHFQILDTFMEVFNRQSRVFCDVLAKRNKPEGIDIYPLVIRSTLDIICEASMGISINAQTEDSEYANDNYKINQILIYRLSKPWLANDIVFSLTPMGREYNQLLPRLHAFTEKVIHNRREELKSNPIKEFDENGLKIRRPLVDILVGPSGEGLTDADIREEIDTFMFEGHDTTASTIGWFLYNMAVNPEHQEKCYKELYDIFGDSDRECTQEDLSQMTYLECCIKESSRMFTTVPLIERFAHEDVQIGNYLIPAGSNILVLLHRMHRNPRIYPEPTEFKPERFFPDNSNGRHPYAYVPFSAGPRNCIGQKFAQTEVKVTTSTLLRNFKFSASLKTMKVVPAWLIVTKPHGGLELIVTPRKA